MRCSLPRKRNNGSSWVWRRGADGGGYTNKACLKFLEKENDVIEPISEEETEMRK